MAYKLNRLSDKISNAGPAELIVALGLCGLAQACQSEKDLPRPNILLILSDDHSCGAISSYGPSLINTPNIDRIAQNGVRFSNCFTVVSLSAPSRAAILTGRYSANNGVLRIGDTLDKSIVTFPGLLHDSGYQTALFGKWHLLSEPVGFDTYGIFHNHGSYYDCMIKSSNEKWVDGPSGKVVEGYLTDALTDMSINWLENRDKEKPFCLLLHHKAPHHPWVYPQKYDSLFMDTDLPEPDNFNDDFNGKNRYLENKPCGFSKLQCIRSWHFDSVPEGMVVGTEKYKKWAYQEVFKGYYRLVASLDENIGRLLDYLKSSGLDRNTIIIYMSDNGFFLGDHGLFNKQWMYEESLRIPLIISVPGMKNKAERNDKIVSELDVASTILDYAHVDVPSDFQGQSIKCLAEGKDPAIWRKSHFYHYFNQYEVPELYGLRTERFKIFNVLDSGMSDWEFYDLVNDPEEMKNQINNPYYEVIIDSLKRELFSTRERMESGSKDLD